MCTQRLLACVVASCMLLCTVNGRLLELGDPRAGTDRAPLKVDRVTFNQPQPDGRRILAETKPTSAPQTQAMVKQAPAANSTSNQAQVGIAAVASGKPAAAAPVPATTPVAAPAKAAAPAQPSAAANAKQQPAVTAKPADATTAPVAAKQGPAPKAAAAAPRQAATVTPAAQQKQASSTPPVVAHLAGKLSAPPNKNTDKVKHPDVRIEEMTLAELQKEDAPPSSCRWEPQTRGIKWNVGCGDKPIGANCNGIVLPGPPFCEGQGGSIATVRCLPEGEWGDVQTLC